MGEVIKKSAAAVDILADARTTLTRARERGAELAGIAEERLAATLAFADSVIAQLGAAEAELAPLEAALAAENDKADRLIGHVSDEVWNLVGRPAVDPALDVLFPGGYGYYAEGDVTEQPARMNLLAGLLKANLHPRLDAERGTALADQITAASDALRARVQAAAPVRERVSQLSRMRTALGRTAHTQLASLKRLLKAQGLSEAEIHRVIPDRPQAKSEKPVAPSV